MGETCRVRSRFGNGKGWRIGDPHPPALPQPVSLVVCRWVVSGHGAQGPHSHLLWGHAGVAVPGQRLGLQGCQMLSPGSKAPVKPPAEPGSHMASQGWERPLPGQTAAIWLCASAPTGLKSGRFGQEGGCGESWQGMAPNSHPPCLSLFFLHSTPSGGAETANLPRKNWDGAFPACEKPPPDMPPSRRT